MKQKFLLKAMLLLCALIVGSSSAWAALTPTYTLTATQNGSNTGYGNNYNVTIGGIAWSAPGNQNFDGYWRIGGKKAKASDPTLDVSRVITGKNAITGQIKKVTVFHNGKSHNALSVPTVTLTIASNSDFSDVVDEIEVHPSISTSIAGSFDFTPTSPITYWEDCYYKFTINITNTTTTNYGLDLKSIAFYIESADVAITGISLPSTADVPVGKTRTLTATVTPDNHTGTVDWESDNTSIATVTSEGVVTGVATGSTTIRAKSHADNTIKAECTVTVNEDVATLPFIWAGGSTSNLTALYGVTGNSLGNYADNDSNRPYLVQFNAVGDYIQIRTNAQPGKVYVGVKMLGGSATSKIKIQESEDGSVFTDVEEFEISGSQYDELNFETTTLFKSVSRYVRIIKSVHASGGNIGVGPIKITECKAISVTAACWASFSSASALDFTGTDVTAYIAKEKDASNVTLTPIKKVPANTGIVVNAAAAGTYAIPVLDGASDATTGNLLQPWLTDGTPSAATYYTLAVDGGNPIFKKSSGGTLAGGKAYLDLSGASAPVLNISFENGDVTGVKDVRSNMEDVKGEVYNLNGQRVAQPTKGLYIVNGKKVVLH